MTLNLTYDPITRPLWTIREAVEVVGRFVRQIGGPGMYGYIKLRLEPYSGEPSVRFVDEAMDDGPYSGDEEFRAYVPAVCRGIEEALNEMAEQGTLMGQIQITLTLLRFHPVDSREFAYHRAAIQAMQSALIPENLIELQLT